MQIFVNGFISGLVLAVLTLGFTVVYMPTRVFAIALAGVYSLSPYVAWVVLRKTHSWPLALTATWCSSILLCLLFEWANHGPLARRGATPTAHLIASLGSYIIIVQVVALLWGNDTQVLRTGIDATYSGISVILTRSQVIAACASVLTLAVFYVWLRCTRLGLQFRALSDNPIQLALHGYNTDALKLLANGMAGFLVSTASLLTALDVGFDPHTGLHALLLAIVAMIVGGRQSFLAPIFGGLLIGVLRSQVVWYSSARWEEPATFLLLVLVLFLRPQGIVGRKERLEATCS